MTVTYNLECSNKSNYFFQIKKELFRIYVKIFHYFIGSKISQNLKK